MKIIVITTLALGFAQSAFAMDRPQDELNKKLLAWVGSNCQNFNSNFLATEVKRLLDAGADPNAQVEYNTALQLAAAFGHEPVCKLLLEYGADVNGKNKNGQTPLMQATKHVNICKLLIDSGAHINAQMKLGYDAPGYNALHYAALCLFAPDDKEQAKVCLLLLEHGADLTSCVGPWNESALIAAAHHNGGRAYICEQIIAYQKRINTTTKTTLLCLRRLRVNNQCPALLYREFNTLLRPHMGYVSLKQLLNMRNNEGKRAYDYLQIDCLNPDYVYPGLRARQTTPGKPDNVNESEPNYVRSWSPNCSIQ